MNCTESANNLTAYLDHQLSGNETKDLESHLILCRNCREELESLRESAAIFDSKVRELEPAPALWDKVRVRIAAVHAPAVAPRFWDLLVLPRWAAVAAAMAAVIILAGMGVSEYLNYQQTQNDLSQYMNRYVQEREAQERSHRVATVRIARTVHEEYSDNPFVASTEETQYSNPFQEQGQ